MAQAGADQRVVQIALAYELVSAGLRHLTALQGVLVLLFEPVLNPVWAGIVHGEWPGAWSLLGGLVILAATIAGTLRESRPGQPSPSIEPVPPVT